MRNPQKVKKEAMVEQKKARIIEYLSVQTRCQTSHRWHGSQAVDLIWVFVEVNKYPINHLKLAISFDQLNRLTIPLYGFLLLHAASVL